MKKSFFILIILFLASCGVKNVKTTEIKIGNKIIAAEVVEISQDQARGLSGRESLGEDEGMLFVYNEKTEPTFWMKDMRFAIDIIWISGNEIIDISENLPMPSGGEIARIKPKSAVNYVLEVNAGFVEKNGVKVGDRVGIDKIK